MSEKVFCKKCKWLHRNFFDRSLLSCEPKEFESYDDPIDGESRSIVSVPERHPSCRNEDLDCEYFTLSLMSRFISEVKAKWKSYNEFFDEM